MPRRAQVLKYLTPDIPEDELDRLCRSFSIPNDPRWLGNFMGAIYPLTQAASWELYGTVTPDEAAAFFAQAMADAFEGGASCNIVPSPYWDDATDNEISEPETIQPWYGVVSDWAAPIEELDFTQNLAVWALTGFVAYAAGPGAAIFFRTTARQFVVAVEGQDIPEIIRIVVDASEFEIDTTGKAGEIINQVVVGDPDLEEHDIYVIKGEFP